MTKPSLYIQFHGEASRATRIGINTTFVLLFLLCYGLWKDFIASEHWRAFGFYLTCAITVAITIVLYIGVFNRISNGVQHQSTFKNTIGFLATPLFVFFLVWIPLVFALPDIATSIFGAKKSISVQLEKKHLRSRFCSYYLLGDPLDGTLLNRVCITPTMYTAMPDSAHVTFDGKSSYFGFHISNVKHELKND